MEFPETVEYNGESGNKPNKNINPFKVSVLNFIHFLIFLKIISRIQVLYFIQADVVLPASYRK